MFPRLLIALTVAVGIAAPAKTQVTEPDAVAAIRATEHVEIQDDAYLPPARDRRVRTTAFRHAEVGFFTVQVNVDENGDNIVGDAANEPSIAVNPNDPNSIVIGWRQFDTISSNFRQAGYGYTTNGGQSWTFPGVIEPGVFRSDPVLDADSTGTFYYNSLTVDGSDFLCHVFKSTDGGATWDEGTFAEGGDKQWMIIDKNPGIGQNNIYAYWTQWFSICFPGHFTRSYNGGMTYLSCIEVPGNPNWGTMAIGPDHELYVCGDGFSVAKSSNAKYAIGTMTWDFSRVVNLDGGIVFGGGPNPGGLSGQAWIAADNSDGPYRGNVYLLCSVWRSSTSDPLDVMFARSEDGGDNWSDPIRVNDDPGDDAYQWFGTMSVAPNGRIDVIWLDTRADPGGYDSVLHYSYSEDAGQTWSASEPLTPAFDPHLGWPQQNKMGDYFDMVSDNAGVHLAYAATFNGEQDVYYARIQPSPPLCPGDLNCDGVVDFDDIDPFVAALGCPSGDPNCWDPTCPWLNGDVNDDGTVDFDDIDPFVARIGVTCP